MADRAEVVLLFPDAWPGPIGIFPFGKKFSYRNCRAILFRRHQGGRLRADRGGSHCRREDMQRCMAGAGHGFQYASQPDSTLELLFSSGMT
jgi:hypothetical protein